MAVVTPKTIRAYHSLNKELTAATHVMAGSLVNINAAVKQLARSNGTTK